MVARRVGLGCIGFVIGLAACSDGQHLLGRQAPEWGDASDADTNASACPTAACRDDAGWFGADGGILPAPVPPAAPCDGPLVGELPVAFKAPSLEARLCADRRCHVYMSRLQFAPDGSVWVLASVSSRDSSLPSESWIGRFARDGTQQFETFTEGSPGGLLAVDDHGQGWLVTGMNRTPTLRRFDAELQPLGEPYPVPRPRSLAAAPGQGVLLLSAEEPATITALGFDGNEVWTREANVGLRGSALVASADGYATLNQIERTPAISGLSIAVYDADGSTRWRRSSSLSIGGAAPRGLLGDWAFFYAFDVHSNFVLAVVPPNPMPVLPTPWSQPGQSAWFDEQLDGTIDIESIDPRGETRWSLRVASSPNVGIAMGPAGDVWVADPGDGFIDAGRVVLTGTVAVIAEDGSTCQRYGHKDIFQLDALEFSPTGELWFIDQNGVGEGGFGRFALPAP